MVIEESSCTVVKVVIEEASSVVFADLSSARTIAYLQAHANGPTPYSSTNRLVNSSKFNVLVAE